MALRLSQDLLCQQPHQHAHCVRCYLLIIAAAQAIGSELALPLPFHHCLHLPETRRSKRLPRAFTRPYEVCLECQEPQSTDGMWSSRLHGCLGSKRLSLAALG